ncbi:PAS domain-containing protein [bacterium]|nr:PAS domain-containing protein [bacterium]MBU1881212.1 PAS domain-containing protein [bacterium]
MDDQPKTDKINQRASGLNSSRKADAARPLPPRMQRDLEVEFEHRISKLIHSFEERVHKFKTHINDLENRVEELSVAKDRARSAFDDFLSLQELNEMIRSTLEPVEVVSALVNLVQKSIDFEAMGVYLIDSEKGGLKPLGVLPSKMSQVAKSQYDEGIIDWVIGERRPVIVPWTETFGSATEDKTKHLILTPLIVADQPLGIALTVTTRNPDRFSSHDLRLLFFAVSHAAVAIQNALQAREIAQTRDFLSNLLENAGDIIISLDQFGKISYVNPSIEELGLNREELIEKHFKALFHNPEAERRIQSTLKRGSRQVFDLTMEGAGKNQQKYTVNLVPLKSSDNQRIGALAILRNVSELNRLQKKLLESERLAAYTQTVITLNHEINNPLTTVLGNVYLLDKEAQSSKDTKLTMRLKVIQENCQRIQRVIKRLERIDELKTVSYLGSTKMVDLGDDEATESND